MSAARSKSPLHTHSEAFRQGLGSTRSCRGGGSGTASGGRKGIIQVPLRSFSLRSTCRVEARAQRVQAPQVRTACREGLSAWAQYGPEREEGGRGRAYSFVGCLSHLTIHHASLSRRSNRAGGGDKRPATGAPGRLAGWKSNNRSRRRSGGNKRAHARVGVHVHHHIARKSLNNTTSLSNRDGRDNGRQIGPIRISAREPETKKHVVRRHGSPHLTGARHS